MDFADKFFLKNLYEDVKFSYNNTIAGRDLSAKIKKAAYSNNGIKEICSLMRYGISTTANDIYDCISKYAQFRKIDIESKPLVEIYGMMIEEFREMLLCEYDKDYVGSLLGTMKIDGILRNIKTFIRKCDDIINFIQYTYRLEAQKDERFEKISLKAMLDIYSGTNSAIWTEDIMPTEENGKSYVENDKLSPEYGKLVCKRIRAMKADVLSAANKYFGKNSKLASFNLMDIVL
jgi:hypothetical protein